MANEKLEAIKTMLKKEEEWHNAQQAYLKAWKEKTNKDHEIGQKVYNAIKDGPYKVICDDIYRMHSWWKDLEDKYDHWELNDMESWEQVFYDEAKAKELGPFVRQISDREKELRAIADKMHDDERAKYAAEFKPYLELVKVTEENREICEKKFKDARQIAYDLMDNDPAFSVMRTRMAKATETWFAKVREYNTDPKSPKKQSEGKYYYPEFVDGKLMVHIGVSWSHFDPYREEDCEEISDNDMEVFDNKYGELEDALIDVFGEGNFTIETEYDTDSGYARCEYNILIEGGVE